MIYFQSHQKHTRVFLEVNPNLTTFWVASPSFNHDRFCTMLSYVIHFSSPVTNRLRNGLILLHFFKDSLVEIQSIMFFVLIGIAPKHQVFFLIHLCTNGLKLFYSLSLGCLSFIFMVYLLYGFIDNFDDGPTCARCIFNIKNNQRNQNWPQLAYAVSRQKHNSQFQPLGLLFALSKNCKMHQLFSLLTPNFNTL